MKKIVLAGLPYAENLGDVVLFMASEHMIRRSLSCINGIGYDLVPLDMKGYKKKNVERFEGVEKDPYYIVNKMLLSIKRNVSYYSVTSLKTRSCVRSLANELIDKDTIAVIFVGGGIIKYKFEFFPEAIDEITKVADRYNIPVMFSGVGVEGYDDTHPVCRSLQKVINRKCVKMITTRDDMENLKKYIKRQDIILSSVADPACSLSEIFPAKHAELHDKKEIGINIVRTKLFPTNGVLIEEDDQIRLWADIYAELTERGYNCRLYCNGMTNDYNAGKMIEDEINRRNNDNNEILLSRPTTGEELINTINLFDGVVSCRLHSAIVSYAYGIPFVGLVWNNKQTIFGDRIGHKDRMIQKEDFNVKKIADTLEKAMDEGYNQNIRKELLPTTEIYIKKFLESVVDVKER